MGKKNDETETNEGAGSAEQQNEKTTPTTRHDVNNPPDVLPGDDGIPESHRSQANRTDGADL